MHQVYLTSPTPGDSVAYVLGSLPLCVRVTHADNGADGRAWVWIVGGSPPQWTLHVPAKEVTPDCNEGQQEAKRR